MIFDCERLRSPKSVFFTRWGADPSSTPFSRLLRRAGDAVDLFKPRSTREFIKNSGDYTWKIVEFIYSLNVNVTFSEIKLSSNFSNTPLIYIHIKQIPLTRDEPSLAFFCSVWVK